jgi:hypothetical protein
MTARRRATAGQKLFKDALEYAHISRNLHEKGEKLPGFYSSAAVSSSAMISRAWRQGSETYA